MNPPHINLSKLSELEHEKKLKSLLKFKNFPSKLTFISQRNLQLFMQMKSSPKTNLKALPSVNLYHPYKENSFLKRVVFKTKYEVIATAVQVVNSYHPNKEEFLCREATSQATFVCLCQDIPENCPNASARTIFNYIYNTLALTRKS